MNWPAIFLGCFVIGFVLSVLSFAFGVIDAHVHFSLGDPRATPAPCTPDTCAAIGPINFATITAFVAWFGGAGYLLTTAVPLAGAAGARRLTASLGLRRRRRSSSC